MPIVNGKYVNPGWVNNSPPALSASEMNAISDTLEQLSQGGGGSGGGTAIPCVVIGTSAGGADTSMCQYVCTGTHDELTIAQADQYAVQRNLPLCFMPGNYNLENTLTINSSVVFGWNRPMNPFGTGMATLVRKNITVQKSVIFKGTVMKDMGFSIDSGITYKAENIELSLESRMPQELDGLVFDQAMGTGIKSSSGNPTSYAIRNVVVSVGQDFDFISLDLFGGSSSYTDVQTCIIENSMFDAPVNLGVIGPIPSTTLEMWIRSNQFGELNLNSSSQVLISENSIQNLSLSSTVPDADNTSNILITSNAISDNITIGQNCSKVYITNNFGLGSSPTTIVDNSSGGVTVANNYNFAS